MKYACISESKSIYPGVGQIEDQTKETVQHTYYQWTPFFLMFLAVLFYSPRYLWKKMEGGRIKMLSEKLRNPMLPIDDKEKEISKLVEYLLAHFGSFNVYTFCNIGCEMLNLTISISSIYMTDVLLGYRFLSYGKDVIQDRFLGNFDRFGAPWTMTTTFPKLTKCNSAGNLHIRGFRIT
jgi:hypothetical protein